METKEINDIKIKPVVHLALKENEISQQELQKLKHLKYYNNDESLTKRKYGLEQI